MPRNYTRANATNRAHAEPHIRFVGTPDDAKAEFLFDPQTSGGLLVAMNEGQVEDFVQRCRDGGVLQTAIVGRVLQREDARLILS